MNNLEDIPPFLLRKNWTDGVSPSLDQPIVNTYTIHNTWKICPYQMYRRYIVKDLPFVETEAINWGNQVHKAFENRLESGKVLPSDMQQWEQFCLPFDGLKPKVEYKLAMTANRYPCSFFAPDAAYRGKADVVLMRGSQAAIYDWKTGNSKYEDPYELEFHAVLLQATHPELTTITGNYVWLKENRLGERYYMSFNVTWDKMQVYNNMIEVARKLGDPKKTPSPLCAWCPVKDCEHNKGEK